MRVHNIYDKIHSQMERNPNDRLKLSCSEAGDIISAVDKTIEALLKTDGNLDEIKAVAKRLEKEVGWPEEVVNAYVENRMNVDKSEEDS